MTYWSGGTQLSPNNHMLVSKTINDGGSWIRYTLTSGVGYTASLAVDPSNSNIVYAGGYENSSAALYKTTSSGASWFSSSTGITGDTVHDIVIHPDTTNIIFAGTSDGVFKSTDSGSSWSNIGCTAVHALLQDPDQLNIIYAGTQNGVFKSVDGGDNWNVMNDGLSDIKITCLGICPDEYVFTSTEESSMYRWNLLSGIEQVTWSGVQTSIIVHPNPTRGQTTITYQLAHTAPVRISVYDIQGRLVETIVNETQVTGAHQAMWHGLDEHGKKVSAGVYFLEFITGDTRSNTKLLVIR